MIQLDGKKISEEIKSEIRVSVDNLILKKERPPHLAAILVGNNGASMTYVNAKIKACQIVGFDSTLIRLDEDVSIPSRRLSPSLSPCSRTERPPCPRQQRVHHPQERVNTYT